ncbi:MAG: right-handed parallel beta-helix repeat-containing protein, partial [Clostridia bacterium]|nr:right-handed parallel beta-helix repeat-containing protein [Clostridia bacterium]
CTFEDVYACVGTHHAVADEFRASDVEITDNTMNNIRAFCVFTDCFDNVLVSGNTAVDAGCFARFNNSKVVMQNNKFTANTKNVEYEAVNASGNTNLTATGNILSGAGKAGIKLDNNCVGNIQNNTVENALTDGVSVLGGSTLTAKNNTVTNSGTHGFYINNESKAELVLNSVKTTQGPAVQVDNKSTLTAKDNIIDKSGKVALYCSNSSKLIATGNTISNSASSGIQVSDSSAAEIKKNTVSKAGGKGIHILKATGCVIEGNKVTASKNHAVMVEGVKGNPGTATVKSNTLDSTGGKDLRLGAYALNCTVGLNTLKHNTFSVDATATYTTVFAAPKLTGISNAKAGITVKWNKSGAAAKYRILRKSGSGAYKKLADVSGKTLSYTDKSAKSGTKYTYTVRCVSGDGLKNTSDYDKTGKTLLRLSAPTLKKATPASKKITVTWGKVGGAKGYYVYRKTGSGKYSKVATVSGTSYTDKKVSKGKKYTYTVYAYNGSTKSAANTTGISAKAK